MSKADGSGVANDAEVAFRDGDVEGRVADKIRAAVAYYERELAAREAGVVNVAARAAAVAEVWAGKVANETADRDQAAADLEAARARLAELEA